ncbi:MAG TPA: hypothetical protein VIC07_04930 [Acidimicrobiia bacterium]
MTNRETSGWAIGWITFAAVMMIMIGFFHGIAGLVGVLEDDLYVLTNEYLFELDVTTWGWIHLVMGVLAIVAGFYLFTGAVWARTIGVILAVVSALANFAWLPWYPVWSIIMITASVFVIWALTAHGRDVVQRV